MVDSQPGKVTAFDPSLVLTDFIGGTRDRFLFNENQLVLAKIQRPAPVSASSYVRNASNVIQYFNNYKNLDGEFAYIDGSFQSLNTTGVPTLPIHSIKVSFDQQVSTGVLKFWSTSFVQTGGLTAQYSFDDATWFDVGTISWVEVYDDTIERFPGDSPPTGEYVYTGTIDSGEITARYWRIGTDPQQAITNFSGSTVTVASTDGFLSAGTAFILDSLGDFKHGGAWTGKTATTLTGWTGTDPNPSDIVVSIQYTFGPTSVTEVQILPGTGPVLEHWNSDGSKAVTNPVEGSNYFDITYDKADDVYYAIRFDTELEASSTLDPDDDFTEDFGTGFDPSKWIQDPTNSYFLRNTTSGTLDMRSSGGRGQLTGNYGIDGDLTVDVSLVAAVELNATAYFGVEVKDYDSGNQYMVSALRGPYIPGSDTTGKFVAGNIIYSDTIGSAAELQDFRIKPDAFDFTTSHTYLLTYVSASDHYTVTEDAVPLAVADPGVPYSIANIEFTISNLTSPADGQSFQILTVASEASIAGTSVSGINLQLERIGTNGYVRYEDTDAPGFISQQNGYIPTNRVKVQLYGDPVAQDVDIQVDDFDVTSASIFFDSPVFSVVTINKDGDLEQVASVSDADGYAIKIFDTIQNSQATFNDYLYPKVGITTNGQLHGSGGAVFIKINDTLYKYLKSTLPLAEDTGASATLVTTGEIPSTGITNFSFSGYSQGGLSYIQYIPDLSGVFVKSIYTTTLLASSFKALLDVSTIAHPFAWNVSDASTLYFIDGTDDLKLYDLNETKAGFVNVTSDKQVLAAGTVETATITAQVLNVYGEPKSAKTMSFSVSAGDGAISPFTGCSDASGIDTTTYTVGSTVGTATITVTVSDITCP